MQIEGKVAAGFEPVRAAFLANFEEHGDSGGACCVYVGGKPVVDLWGGFASIERGEFWNRDTIQIVFSATKGPTAACVLWLAEHERLDIDAPIARYWPEFAASGKGDIPVRWALSHRAGLAAIDGELTLEQVLAWTPVVDAIAAQAPNWAPGTAHGYHVRSYGWILGEIVRRVTGKTLGRFLKEIIARPFDIDFCVGLARREYGRCATLIPPENNLLSLTSFLGADSLTARAMSGPSGLFGYTDMWNRPEVLAAEMPSSNGVGHARALARFYAALIGELDGKRLLAPETVEAACVVQSEGSDRVIILPTCFGLGFALRPMLPPGSGPRSFGHPGAGGSMAFADPDAEMSFAYVSTRMKFEIGGDPRSTDLVAAVYQALA